MSVEMAIELKTLGNYKSVLGESPVYDMEKNKLFWVDIDGKKIIVNSLDTNEENYYNTPDVVTSLCLIDNIRIIVTLRHGFHILDLTTGKILPFLELQNDKENRFNDGKCDVMGRYWAGTMNLDIESPKPTASLYKLEDKKLTKVLEKLYRSNGLGWDPDNELFYLIDTPLRKVFEFDFDKNKGDIYNKRVVIDFKDEPGRPDGMTVDEEGHLWIAHSAGGKVSRWNPKNGEKVFEIKLPVVYVSSVTFGSPEMNRIFITTMSRGSEPLAGRLFTTKVNIRGLQSYKFLI
ncbi:SMP-30/gluconolactonase/LRE family protein [Sulfolobus islandicus]|uniref:SMP-30/Gluconolaconase/LRE domain protein n=1 Tax=Saccharolobus islandicus (strain HVE10/4) TaxID=930943 RepID=F0NLA7_SACI0|nr:SMP-30/gluconolactonase/LRE family protein [Sulfolobus islandicus]ADX83598.1 SMP-30/Gluconolaconase/LRE domain protein [Sulfolobus islandicus HVE10/4]WCM37665.1 SMP-30/gluconolactonase/LRE family protein [Sulfolobus islandicus]